MTAKRQHYVPRFLLRYFTVDGERLQVLDKRRWARRTQSINNTALQKYFYDYMDEGKLRTLEGDLARLEYDSANILHQVVSDRSLRKVTSSERRVLAFFVATQALRTRQERVYAQHLWDMTKDMVQLEEFSETWFSDLEWDEVDFAEQQISNMRLLAPLYTGELENYHWFLLAPSYNQEFWTSDHPVVVWNRSASPDAGLGLLEDEAEVYLPLTPDLLLLVAHPGGRKAKSYLGAGGTASPLTLLPGAIRLLNGLQVVFSERFVFSRRGNFELAYEMLASHPEWHEGPKPESEELLDLFRYIAFPETLPQGR